ncbi:hypothetical protein NP493_2044g00000 [Ridgeia piscesae]|uniref:Uncharacterized protein n=1 Tax=Ridgeia piscesae TaxID=27915 RepID=A0AAD9JMF9_RIDPI|nr:hypothetical protein NP493_2044g00000 [Ridgeia piscesae]
MIDSGLVQSWKTYSCPLSINSDVLYNTDNIQVRPNQVIVRDGVLIDENMANSFRSCLPSGFHAKISSQVKTIDLLKRGIQVGDKTLFDLETIFLHLHIVGKKR